MTEAEEAVAIAFIVMDGEAPAVPRPYLIGTVQPYLIPMMSVR
jgi:hypothetical protein